MLDRRKFLNFSTAAVVGGVSTIALAGCNANTINADVQSVCTSTVPAVEAAWAAAAALLPAAAVATGSALLAAVQLGCSVATTDITTLISQVEQLLGLINQAHTTASTILAKAGKPIKAKTRLAKLSPFKSVSQQLREYGHQLELITEDLRLAASVGGIKAPRTGKHF